MSTLTNLFAELAQSRAEALHDNLVRCNCGEMLASPAEWAHGPRITHSDFGVRLHDPKWCGTGDDEGYYSLVNPV